MKDHLIVHTIRSLHTRIVDKDVKLPIEDACFHSTSVLAGVNAYLKTRNITFYPVIEGSN